MSSADLASPEFWARLSISFTCKGPLMHIYHVLLKSQAPSTEADAIEPVLMVMNKLESISTEFSDLFEYPWRSLVKIIADHTLDADHWVCTAVTATLYCASSYWRRLGTRFLTWPFKLLWIAHTLPGVDCQLRRAIAEELIVSPDTVLDPFSIKFRAMFYEHINYSAGTGYITEELFQFIKHLCLMMRVDTQCVEGANSMIKHMCRLSLSCIRCRPCRRVIHLRNLGCCWCGYGRSVQL